MALLVWGWGWAQQPAPDRPSQPPSRPQPGPETPAPDRRAPPSPDRREQERRFEDQFIFLYGKVVIEDGSPLPEPVRVELICHSQVRLQVYTRSGGDFSLQLGGRAQSGTTLADASVSSPGFGSEGPNPGFRSRFGGMDLSGCELRAALPGFQSDAIVLGVRRTLDDGDLGLLVLRRLANVEGTTVSFNTLAAPRRAKNAYDKAQRELGRDKPRFAPAAKELEKAVQEYPEFAAAWHLLARVRLEMEDETGAREAFTRAMESDPNYVEPYVSLATLEIQKGHWKESAGLLDRVLELNPYITHARYLSAVTHYELGELDEAAQSIQEVRKSAEAPRYPSTHYLMGAILARRGDLPSAASEFRQWLDTEPEGPAVNQVSDILKQWEQEGVISKQPEEEP